MLARRMQMAASAVSAAPWYLSGGAPAPVAVYEAKGAASQAASYVNIVSPGTFDAAPGVAPTWAAGTGWGMDGSTSYLTTGIVPANDQTWAALCRFSDGLVTATRVLLGASNGPGRALYIASASATGVRYTNGGILAITPALANGVLGVAADKGYRDGTAETGVVGAWTGTISNGVFIGALNGGVPGSYFSGNIQYVVIWNTSTGHATWMPDVSAAVSAL